MTRILVTGSRHWPDSDALRAALDELLAQHGQPLTVVVGDCPTGADRMARRWALDRRASGARLEVHHADWHRYGRAAGPIRNRRMVASGADVCLAFIQPGAASRGTRHCVGRAERAGIPVTPYGDASALRVRPAASHHEEER